MIKWDDLRLRCLRVLADDDRTNPERVSFTDEDMVDYANQALVAITPHTAQEKIFTVESFSAETSLVDLPDDLYELGPMYVVTPTLDVGILRQELKPGETMSRTARNNREWKYYEWPTGRLNFPIKIPQNMGFRAHYWGYWDRVTVAETKSQTLRIPRWMEEPIQWYILHLAAQKPGFQAATLGQYKTRTDSGTPIDNPLTDYSKFCLKNYENKIAQISSQDRSQWRT